MNFHEHFMQRAIQLAQKARFHAPPNPWVGCVVVKDGRIVGEGFTQPPGQSHAEVCALLQAKELAKGATLYVTLEPCAHTGRTPPCSQALIQAGLAEVHVGVLDPDLRVSGKGIAQLQQAGIEVKVGLCEKEVLQQLSPYLHQRQNGLPYTLLKSAMSLDGRIAAADYTSQWITNEQAREDAHLLRASSQAIVIGAKTALKDMPKLTVRHPAHCPLNPPLRVLLDSRGQVPAKGPLFDRQLAPTLVISTAAVLLERRLEWEAAGAEVECVSATPQGIDLDEAWQLLAKRSVLQVLVEGGATLQTALLEKNLFDQFLVYVGPLLLGSSGLALYQQLIPTLTQAKRLKLCKVQQLGDCVRLDYAQAK